MVQLVVSAQCISSTLVYFMMFKDLLLFIKKILALFMLLIWNINTLPTHVFMRTVE